jgi:murein hydrolase activator
LRARIQSLSAALEQKEASRREARDALRASERAISEANRELAALDLGRRELRAEAAHIAARRRALEVSLAERGEAIERLLRARQAGRSPDALRLALSAQDPAEIARTLHYLGHLSRAAAAMLRAYRSELAELKELDAQARAKADSLQALEQARRSQRERVLSERRDRQALFERLAGEIRQSRKQIKVLRADETRLARLVEELGRVIASRRPAEALRVEKVPEGRAAPGPFSRLRGKLRLPVRGELTGRFGAPRGASGTEAKGVFIRAPEGQPVRVVASGQVVYADWMRGFGNLLIVDHGEAYLSIYANAEALLKQVGEPVAAGETVATTGASGGNEETGLYFELRHLGKPFDPLRWVRLR